MNYLCCNSSKTSLKIFLFFSNLPKKTKKILFKKKRIEKTTCNNKFSIDLKNLT